MCMRWQILSAFLACLLVAILFAASFELPQISLRDAVGVFDALNMEPEVPPEPRSFLFVGDVMLARDVERTMDTFGAAYPFQSVTTLFDEHDFLVANFEASVPEVHQSTPDLQYNFFVKDAYLETLIEVGFTHLSLANNHSYDAGRAGYSHTRERISALGGTPFGTSYAFGTTSTAFVDVDGVNVGLLALDFTVTTYDDKVLRTFVHEQALNGDLLIVYVHWGTEYQAQHSSIQERYSRLFVDAGADLVIGHHPHVVQDVGFYNGVPIFYSLGNFIFDQYFDPTVEEGLVLSLSPQTREITLIPVSSAGSRNAPRTMPGRERQVFLDALAKRSDMLLQEGIEEGILRF